MSQPAAFGSGTPERSSSSDRRGGTGQDMTRSRSQRLSHRCLGVSGQRSRLPPTGMDVGHADLHAAVGRPYLRDRGLGKVDAREATRACAEPAADQQGHDQGSIGGQPRPRGRRVVSAAWRSQLRGPVGAPSRRSAGSARNELAPRARSRAAQGSRTASFRDPLHLPRPDPPRSTARSRPRRPAFDTPRRDQPGDDRLIQSDTCGRDRRRRARP